MLVFDGQCVAEHLLYYFLSLSAHCIYCIGLAVAGGHFHQCLRSDSGDPSLYPQRKFFHHFLPQNPIQSLSHLRSLQFLVYLDFETNSEPGIIKYLMSFCYSVLAFREIITPDHPYH